MRVLLTSDAVSEVWTFSTTLAHTLAAEHGVQVLLAVCGPAPTAEQLQQLGDGVRKSGGSIDLEVVSLPLETADAADRLYHDGRQALLQLALKWRAHILHANEYHLGQIGSSGLPVLVTAHGDLCSLQAALGGDPARTVSPGYRRRVIAGLEGAALVTAAHAEAIESLHRWYGYGDVIRVIPPGVQIERSQPPQARTVEAAIAGALWDPVQNLSCFRSAVAPLPGTFAALGPRGEPGAATAEPADDHLHYGGALQYSGGLRTDELRAFLSRTKVLVSAAHYEPLGLSLIEGALAGCCLLLSNIPEYRQRWENAALYFDPHNPVQLRAALQVLLGDAERMRALAERARARAESHFSAAQMGRAYLRSYQRLALRYGISL